MLRIKIIFLFLLLQGLSFNGWTKTRIYIADTSIKRSDKEALLILPGFGSKMHGTKEIAAFFFNGKYDVFIPDYISRKSIAACVQNLDEFMQKEKLPEYAKLHVFSYIIGSWTLNCWIQSHPVNNITTIVYDRSPLQERAPFALVNDLSTIISIISGKIMKEFARTPYPTIEKGNYKIGILIENKATKMIHKHRESAFLPGPIRWEADSLHQTYDDFTYIWVNHDEMYTDITSAGNEVWHFIAHGTFSSSASRKKSDEDPFIEFKKN